MGSGRVANIDKLLKIGSDQIKAFNAGDDSALPDDLKLYTRQITRAADIYGRTMNINQAAKVLTIEFGIPHNTARDLVYDSVTYFHLRSHVRKKAWANFFAHEDLPKLKKLALAKGDIDLAFKITIEQFKILQTIEDESFSDEELEMRPQLISPDVTHERLGLKKESLHKLFSEATKLIRSFDISEEQKEELIKEATLNLGYQLDSKE